MSILERNKGIYVFLFFLKDKKKIPYPLTFWQKVYLTIISLSITLSNHSAFLFEMEFFFPIFFSPFLWNPNPVGLRLPRKVLYVAPRRDL